MKLFLLIFFISAIENCLACSGSGSSGNLRLNGIPGGTTPPSDLKFTAGDIISCDFETVLPFSDIMLATSRSSVIHIEGGDGDKTRILEEDFLTAAGGFKLCKVITKFYDEKYASSCGGTPFSTAEILRRTDQSRTKFRGQTTHFHPLKCNSEHWVSAWRYGTSWTLQIPNLFRSKYRSDNCQAPGKQECF